MYQEKPRKIFAHYAVPQMIGLLLNSVYLIVDGVFIGNRLGRDAMAAAAVSVPVIEILIALALFIASGAGILISARLGRGETKEANRIFNLSVGMLGGVSLLFVVLGNLFLPHLASFLGAPPLIHAQAMTYLWYIVTFSPFLLFSFLLSALVRSDNRPRLAMVALAVGSVSNIVLDYVFMYPLNMGIGGAALATALGPIFSVLILLPHFLRKKGVLHFAKPQKPAGMARAILVLGFPAFIMEFSIGIVTFIYNFAIVASGYGELGLAAYLILGYMALIILTVFLGIAQGLQPVFSYYNGAGQAAKNKALLAYTTKMVIAVGLVLYGAAVVFARPVVAVFAAGDAELVAFTSGKVALYFWGFLFAGLNIVIISFWQAMAYTKKALLLSLLRSVVLLPVVIAILPLLAGKSGIWAAHSVAELATAGVALLLFAAAAKKQPQAGSPLL